MTIKREYYPNGQLKEARGYKDGLPHGRDKEYYGNGQLMRETFLNNGKFIGQFKSYHANGQLAAEAVFKPYEPFVMLVREYDENGRLKQ